MGIALGKRGFACAAAALALALLAVFACPTTAQADQQLTTSATKASASAEIEPGTYYVQSWLSSGLMLHVAGSSKDSGANVRLGTAKGKAIQQWRIEEAKGGTYTITNVSSGKRLASADSQPYSGTNVQQSTAKNAKAQRWLFKKSGTGYIISNAADPGYVLDVTGAYGYSGTNVQLYDKNGTDAQRWLLVPAKTKVESERTVDNGIYELRLASADKFGLEVAGSRYGNGADVKLHKATSAASQRWSIRWDGGWYQIRNISSGKLLEAAESYPIVRESAQQGVTTGKGNQRWAIVEAKGGSYQLINKATGLALDVAGAKAANGTSVRMHVARNSAAQRFDLVARDNVLASGAYAVYTRLSPAELSIGIPKGSAKAGVQARVEAADDVMAQRLILEKVDDDTYTIQMGNSGLFLTDVKGKVQQKKATGKASQQWRASLNGGAISFTNVATGKRMAVSGGKSKAGAKLVTAKAKAGKAQRFRLVSESLIPNGYYTLKNAWGGKMLDVDGGSTSSGANVQVYANNDSAAQTWCIKQARNGYYKIVNDGSGLVLGVKKASTKSKADVRQYKYDGSDAQLWEPQLLEGGRIVFVNKASGMALDAAGKKNSSNVRQLKVSGRAAQEWTLAKTESKSLSGDPELDQMVRNALAQIGYGGDRLKKAFNWVSGYRYANGSKYPTGNWSIPFAKEMFTYGAGNCYRFAAVFCWLARGLGYNAQAVSGYVPHAGGGWAPHGWVEVYYNGGTYVCDPDLAHELPGHNWYWVTYANAPTTYSW